MAVLNKADAVAARVATDIAPAEAAINEHLTTQRVIDYVTNTEIDNPSMRVNIDGLVLTNAAADALKVAIEAASWKDVEILREPKRVVVAFSVKEKAPEPQPDVYVATVTAAKSTIKTGETTQLTVTVTKNGQPYTGTPVYTSGTPTFATVNSTGLVTGVAVGTTVITVEEGELYSKTISIVVEAVA